MKGLRIDTKKKEWLIVALIIAITLGRIIYLFAVEKTGEHSDEIWCYGLANSYYQPFIFQNDDRTEHIYVDEWISGQTLRDYITVQEGQRFAYDSVTYNLKHDFHPPLYFYILHTICSFFPNTYSRWFAFSINIAIFPILMIFLYLLARELSRCNKYFAYIVLIVYGLASGGVSTFIFARHYAMLTMWAVIYAYYFVKWLKLWWNEEGITEDAKSVNHSNIKYISILTIVSALGCLTQYFFATYAFILTVIVIVACLCKKQIKRMFAFGSAMVVSLVPMFLLSGVLGSTSSRMQVESDVSEVTFKAPVTLWIKLKVCVECFLYDFTSIKLSQQIDYYLNIFFTTIGLALVILSPIIILTIKKKNRQIKEWISRKWCEFRNIGVPGFFNISLVITCIFSCLAYCILSGDDNMEALTNRYLFIVYPAYVMLLVKLVHCFVRMFGRLIIWLIGKLKIKNSTRCYKCAMSVVAIMLCAAFIVTLVNTEIYYLFPRVENESTIAEITKGADVILPMTEHWLLTCYTDVLRDAENVFVTRSINYKSDETGECAARMSDRPQSLEDNKLYLLIDVSKIKLGVSLSTGYEEGKELVEAITEKISAYYEKAFNNKSMEFVQEDVIFTREVYLYEIK